MRAHSSNSPYTERRVADVVSTILESLAGGLIVSCQAPAGSPMRHTPTIVRFAESALAGGAVGLRINGVDDIAAVRPLASVPIIGLDKLQGARRSVITPTDDQVVALAAAGADVVAVDATREVAGDVAARVVRACAASAAPVMADVSTLDEGLAAWDSGATLVGTTLSGYTPDSPPQHQPDFDLVSRLTDRGVRVIAEGRLQSPEDVGRAFDAGAFAVVVGGAITDPVAITRRFGAATPRKR